MAATNKRGVFSLEKVLERQSDNHWSKIPEVFRYVNSIGSSSPAGTDYGYFMGGWAECCPYLAPFSTVDRLDFSNDTDDMVTKASLTETRSYMRGFSSLTHGYTAGGSNPFPNAPKSSTDRIDYASDTTAQVTKGPLATGASGNIVGLHNTDYGYSLGGWGGPGNSDTYSLSQRLDFSNDTETMSPKGNLTSEKNFGAGAGNQSYGYFSGGTPSRISSVDRIDYSSDTTALAPKGPLSRAVNEHDAAGNADYGYHAGGWDPGTPYATTNDRIDYSNDTATATTKGQTGGKHGPTATGNTSYGYWTGGYGNTTNSYRLDYSSDTTNMAVKGKRTSVSQNGCGTSSRANAMPLVLSTNTTPATRTETGYPPLGTDYGYWFGGSRPVHDTNRSYIQRLDFSNDTAVMTVSSYMTNPSPVYGRGTPFSVASTSYAYASENELGPSLTKSSTIQRLDLANDSVNAPPVSTMPTASINWFAVGNTSYGWIAGGQESPGNGGMSTVNRLDYSNDTATAAPRGTLTFEASSSYSSGAATGNLNYGWFTQGNFDSGSTSYIDRVDYSNDTGTASPRGNLSSPAGGGSATGNLNYGWFAINPGNANRSDIDRVDYSNDTPTASPRGKLSSSSKSRGATGNQSYGYFAGGGGPSPEYTRTSNERVDYSNDTATSSPKGPLYAGAAYISAASSRANGLPTVGSKTVDKGADGYTTSTLGPAYGYIAGGWVPAHGGKTTVDRIDFGNDTATASPKGPLANAAAGRGATGSTAYGYWGGGSTPSLVTHVDRIDYGNDTATASPKGGLSQSKKNLAGVGNNSLGYMAGGQIGGYTASAVDRISFATDTATAAPKGNLSGPIKWNMATGNQSFGYVGSGESPGPYVTTINRIDYSSDTDTTPTKGPLTLARFAGAATGNASFGYFGGGFVAPSGSNKSTVDRLDYSSDTTTAVEKGPLSSARHYLSATGDTSYGYFAGGWYSEPAIRSIVDRVDYSNDTPTASPKGPLSRSDAKFAGASAKANANASVSFIPRIRWVDGASEGTPIAYGPAYGYWLGSYGYTSVVDRIDFSNDTASAFHTANSTWEAQGLAGTSSITHGYWAGGWENGATTTGNRIDYSSDTGTLAVKGTLSVDRRWHMAVGNASYGYQAGGFPAKSSIDRIDYSNDTTAQQPGANLATIRNGSAGAGNKSYGYFAGGRPGPVSIIERLDYSSDTTNTTPKGTLTATSYYKAGASNSDYGWYSGGSEPEISSVDRIDFSNDTATASPKGPLSRTRRAHGATGSPSYGYFGGNESPTGGTSTDRIDYSNDTATASPKGNFTVTWRKGSGGVSAQENAMTTTSPTIAAPVQPPFPYPQQLAAPAPGHGYWSGGLNNATPNPATSEINRIDFSNDTATTVLKGNMHTGRSNHSAIGNQTHAYTGGGSNPAEASPAYLSSIERMTFANDTATSVDKSTFRAAFTQVPSPGQGANGTVSVGNLSYGYWQGANSTYVDRLDYSNDTAQAAAHTNSSIDNGGRASVGNLSYGYMCGGWVSKSIVDRLDYGNDTATMSPKGNLEAPLAQTFGVGNGSYGYIISGRDPSLPTYRTSITRIDFADDTSTSSPKGNLAGTSYMGAGTGNASYGYVIEAQNNSPSFGYYTRIYRIDYSNDTATAPAVSNFSYPGRSMKGFSGRAYGLPN